MLHNRGQLNKADLEAFFKAGYTSQQAIEIIQFISFCTMTNYLNNMAETPLDEER